MEKSFSDILKSYRLENNLSQNEMSIKLGISENMYRMYENGKYNGSTNRIQKYLNKLSANISNISEPDSFKEYGKAPPSREEDLLLVIKNLEARVKDKEEIISLMRDKISKAETIEKLFISALHSPRTLKEFHSLIESSFV